MILYCYKKVFLIFRISHPECSGIPIDLPPIGLGPANARIRRASELHINAAAPVSEIRDVRARQASRSRHGQIRFPSAGQPAVTRGQSPVPTRGNP